MNDKNKNDILGITLADGEEATVETLAEVSNGKGDDEDE